MQAAVGNMRIGATLFGLVILFLISDVAVPNVIV